MGLSADIQSKIINNPNSSVYLKELCNMIKSYGLEEYKKLVIDYNTNLELLKQQGELPTPDDIIKDKQYSVSR